MWLDGVQLVVDDRWASPAVRAAISDGGYEHAERAVLARTLTEDDVYLELGAGIGLLATLAARRITGSTVVAIEANPVMAEVARETAARNGVEADIRNVLLSTAAEATTAPFYVRPDFRESSVDPGPSTKMIPVPVAEAFNTIEAVGATYLMVDIEGTEVDLLTAPLPPCIRTLCVDTHSFLTGPVPQSAMIAALLADGFALDLDRCVLPVLLFRR